MFFLGRGAIQRRWPAGAARGLLAHYATVRISPRAPKRNRWTDKKSEWELEPCSEGRKKELVGGGGGVPGLHCSKISLASISKESVSSAILETLSASLTASDARNDLASASAILYAAAMAASPTASTELVATGDGRGRGRCPGSFSFGVGVFVTKGSFSLYPFSTWIIVAAGMLRIDGRFWGSRFIQ